MRNDGRVLGCLWITACAFFFLLVGCSQSNFGTDFEGTEGGSNGTLNLANPYEQQAIEILQNNCTACHTSTSGPANVFGLTDAQHLVNANLIVPGSPQQSQIYLAITSNMPPTGSLPSVEIQTLQNWILAITPLPSPSPTPSQTLEQQALSVLQANCTACHTSTSGPANVDDLTDPQHLLSAGLVVPGQPTQSPLYIAITSNMPPSGSLSTADIQLMDSWILSLAPASTPSPTPTPSPTATPAPSVTPTPSPSPVAVSFQNLETTLFQPKCVACHSGSGGAGGYAFDTYAHVLASVNLANPTSSVVYTATESGSMPRGGSRLTSQQESQILSWIQAGAPNN